MRKVLIELDGQWVLSRRDDDELPMDVLIESVKKDIGGQLISRSHVSCEMVVTNTAMTDGDVRSFILQVAEEKFGLEDVESIVTVMIAQSPTEETPTSKKHDRTLETDRELSASSAETAEDVMVAINNLVGASEFKALAAEWAQVIPRLIKYHATKAFTHQCYLFSISDGEGLSTYLELMAQLLEKLQVMTFGKANRRIKEERLPAPSKDADGHAFENVLSSVRHRTERESRIVCIDISEWMTALHEVSFRDFLTNVEDSLGGNIVVFRVPFVEKTVLDSVKAQLADVLTVREVTFVPLDRNELRQCAERSLSSFGFTAEEAVWQRFDARLDEEKTDGRFYGINTVDKIVREMLYLKQLSNVQDGVDDSVVKESEILSLVTRYQTDEKSGMELLDEYIGMEDIKKRVEEIVAQIEMSLENKNLGSPCIHMRFVGNPGTGKTTVARVIGKILKERGVLRNGYFFERMGRDLCGRYVGETSPKTAAICRDAYGSVLFIDEAYSLYREGGANGADYGKEAIDTLIAQMENHRSDLVVIMAGYPEEMEHMLEANAGLASRMPYAIVFPNYTREQLFAIFMSMCKKNFAFTEEFEAAAKAYFLGLPEEVVSAKDFSNARFARNLFERAWGKAAQRVSINRDKTVTLTKEDFELASSEREFSTIMAKPKRSLGFV